MSVLGTEATVQREYTRALIRDFADGCAIHLVGSPRLAEFAEAELRGQPLADADIAGEIAPCFIEQDGARTDTIVLACTHYPLLLDRLQRLAPWPVAFIDPAPAIARRVVDLLGPPAGGPPAAATRLIFTSGREPSPSLKAALSGLWHRRDRRCRRLTCPPFPPKNRPSRGPSGPRGVSRPAVCAGASAASLSVPAMPGQEEGAILKPERNMRTR